MSSNPITRQIRLLTTLGVLALAGCGFQPVYGTNGAATVLIGQTSIETTEPLLGYALAGRVVERLGPPQANGFSLSVTPASTALETTVEGGDSATRTFLRGTASFVLTDSTGAIVSSGEVQTTTGYSTTGNSVSTRAAEQDATERLAIMLADLVIARLMADIAS